MATFQNGNFITLPVNSNLSADQYCIVKTDANGNAVLAAADTDDIVGVLEEVPQPLAGSISAGLVSVAHISGNGTFKVIAGASISKGAYLTTDANGHAVAATQTAGGSQPSVRVFGRARYAANSGDVVEYEKCFFLY